MQVLKAGRALVCGEGGGKEVGDFEGDFEDDITLQQGSDLFRGPYGSFPVTAVYKTLTWMRDWRILIIPMKMGHLTAVYDGLGWGGVGVLGYEDSDHTTKKKRKHLVGLSSRGGVKAGEKGVSHHAKEKGVSYGSKRGEFSSDSCP